MVASGVSTKWSHLTLRQNVYMPIVSFSLLYSPIQQEFTVLLQQISGNDETHLINSANCQYSRDRLCISL